MSPLLLDLQYPASTIFAAGFIVHVLVYNFPLHPVAHWSTHFHKNGLAAPARANVIPLGLATGHPDSVLYRTLDMEPNLGKLFNNAMGGSARIYSLNGVITSFGRQLLYQKSGPRSWISGVAVALPCET